MNCPTMALVYVNTVMLNRPFLWKKVGRPDAGLLELRLFGGYAVDPLTELKYFE